jgi:hypothetical protein
MVHQGAPLGKVAEAGVPFTSPRELVFIHQVATDHRLWRRQQPTHITVGLTVAYPAQRDPAHCPRDGRC